MSIDSNLFCQGGAQKIIDSYAHQNASSRHKSIAIRRLASIPGITVKDLPESHVLYGEQGLFATRKFAEFDIIGSYCGRYVGSDARGWPSKKDVRSGHYLARLEVDDYKYIDTLGINAEDCGNELRFINSYLNISSEPNCMMKTTFIDEWPVIVVICISPIEAGDEILLDYGDGYNRAYILPQNNSTSLIPSELLFDELPSI